MRNQALKAYLDVILKAKRVSKGDIEKIVIFTARIGLSMFRKMQMYKKCDLEFTSRSIRFKLKTYRIYAYSIFAACIKEDQI